LWEWNFLLQSLAIGKKAFVIALSEAFLAFIVGYLFGHYVLSFSFFDSLFLALAISITSSVLVMRILEDLGVIRYNTSILTLGYVLSRILLPYLYWQFCNPLQVLAAFQYWK
jgi:Kef-type K+ transport system membrane component KefB